MWSAYADDDGHCSGEPNENATLGLAPPSAPGLDPVELLVDGESFIVTRRPEPPGTYDFHWTSHPESYGFTVGANSEWRPGLDELREEIRAFLAQIEPATGYLPD